MTIDLEAIDEAGRLEAGILDVLVEKLSPYDPVDVLAAVGGLQLLPENADRAVRLEAFAHAAASLEDEADKPRISLHRLRQFANTEPLGGEGVAAQEDPCDNALTEAFTYHGGMYIVFPGHVDESTFHLRHLAQALFSPIMARRAGLGRGVLPIFRGREADVVVPDSQRLAQLKQAVSFSREELERFLAERHLPLSALDRLIASLGSVSIANYQIDYGDLQTCPIVRAGDQFIVALPGMLLVAARHELIRLAIEYGVADELAQHYHAAVWHSVMQSLGYLGNSLFAHLQAQGSAIRGCQHALFHLDSDKLLCVLLVTDSLEGYPSDRVFGKWQLEREKAEIGAQLRLVEEELFSLSSPPNEVLFLVLVQPIGRTLFWNYQGLDTPAASLRLVLTAADLETIAFLEGGEQLALWKYARHSWQVRQQAHVWASGELNEFFLYRTYRHSYYISDSERPDVIHVLPGGAGNLRQEVIRRYDQHAARSYMPDYITDVVTLYDTREVPLYAPLRPHDRRAVCLLEGLPVPIWVIGPSPEEGDRQETLHFSPNVVAAIAYWLWQCGPALRAPFQSLASDSLPIRIFLLWGERREEGEALSRVPIDRITADPTDRSLVLSLVPGMSALFDSADNSGERVLMHSVLEGLGKLLPTSQQGNFMPEAIAVIQDRHIPLGLKKMLLYNQVNTSPDLDPRGLPPYRKIQEADANELLDELGDYLSTVEHLEPGPLPEERRTDALAKAVEFYGQELVRLVASLSSEGLLEFLIAQQEATVRQSSYRELTIPTQLACFSSVPNMVVRLGTELPELADAAVAGRFLIEYVAARPPNGVRPISLSVYERLLALASRMTSFGFASDLIHFQIADIALEVLPSGRLSVNHEQYVKALAAYLPDMLTNAIEGTTETFAEHWHGEEPVEEAPLDLGMSLALDEAARDEFGCSLSDLQRFLAGAFSISEDLDPACARLVYDEFLDRQGSYLGWPREQVARVLKALTLAPRPDFLSPPAPYRQADTYPWRYNRRLSYVRRPFILRQQGEATEVLWGNRHLYRAALSLLRLCNSGLFQADSPAMKQVMGAILHREGEAFNDAVVEVLKGNPELIVVPRVKGIGDLPGDIDVLVADPARRRLGILECKDFAMARTPREIAHELEKLFEGRHGEKTMIEKRADWARGHVGDLLNRLGLDGARNANRWRVEPLIVVSQELLSPYLRRSPIPVVSLQKLIREHLW